MKAPLQSLSIAGFRSIRRLPEFPMRQLNVLVGANGAGKSNFVEFFRMLAAMFQDRLRGFVRAGGRADGFFFEGPRVTREIHASLNFGGSQFRFVLAPVPGGEDLMVKEVGVLGAGASSWSVTQVSAYEAGVAAWDPAYSLFPAFKSREGHVHEAVSSWVVYHFHDTSSLAPMRRDGAIEDSDELRPNADNLAAFLHALRDQHPARYQRIRETVQIIAPFFDDFLLAPRKQDDEEHVRLDWRQRGSSFPYQPWHLSDGTIRFIALVTALLQPSPPATLVVDEPELGLHPAALRVLAALMHEASATTQLVVSTQSPLLVDHFEADDVIVVRRRGAESLFERQSAADLERWLEQYTLGELMQKNVVETAP